MFLPPPFTLVLHAVLLGVMYRWCSTCTVQKDSEANLLLDDIIARAIPYQEDDKVTLKFPQAATAKNDPVPIIRRPRLGQNVSFGCLASTDKNSRDISLTFQGRTLFQHGEALPVESLNNQHYNFAQYGDSLIFQIFNVTLQSSGEIVCYEERLTKKTVIRRYSLVPLVTHAEEIFAQSLVPQTITEGDTAVFTVAVRLPLSQRVLEKFHNQCMWRHKGRLLIVPREEPYTSSLSPTWIPSMVQYGEIPSKNTVGSNVSSQFTFRNAKTDATGLVEFWFRPHREMHEWIYRSAQLTEIHFWNNAPASGSAHAIL
ncbi:uncharacterized protein LOC129585290 [Paramacrobiotus metropolitanus]|uniref:uncharacterized protein LOC129585290 n=1 Tax=Paramacrobiotus metropolitanus TaxID=2943436 RepID=UPI00244582ED|nr:uncharacterized protein LOC129585290 [Paramacrobiotus metropolitanus]